MISNRVGNEWFYESIIAPVGLILFSKDDTTVIK